MKQINPTTGELISLLGVRCSLQLPKVSASPHKWLGIFKQGYCKFHFICPDHKT